MGYRIMGMSDRNEGYKCRSVRMDNRTRVNNCTEGTDNGTKGTDNRIKGTENALKGTHDRT
jgi:hypothetical protein